MAEVAVVKHPKKEGQELTRVLGFETPLFRGNLFTVNPFALMRQFTEEMDRIFGQTPRAAGEGAAWTPTIEVKEKEGKLLVTAELPGVKKEDVKVHIDGDTLVVEGESRRKKRSVRPTTTPSGATERSIAQSRCRRGPRPIKQPRNSTTACLRSVFQSPR
jgi:hypothetical protein